MCKNVSHANVLVADIVPRPVLSCPVLTSPTVQVYCPRGVVNVSALARDYECDGLAPDTDYEFAVSAVNIAGESENASASSSTTCSPSPPTVEGSVISLQGACSVRYV